MIDKRLIVVRDDYNKEKKKYVRVLSHELVYKSTKDVLNEHFNSGSIEDEITKVAILDLEDYMHECLANHLVITVPYVANIRRSIVRSQIRQHYEHFQEKRKTMSIDEFIDYKKEKIMEFKKMKEEIDLEIRRRRKALAKFRKKYEFYKVNVSRNYAELFLKSVYKLDVVEYDKNFDEHILNLLKQEKLEKVNKL